MTESKLLEEDKDEWFYHSMERYSNLYMFELEFPVDAVEIIDDTSICLSGIQNYSKKCELLQLSIPPKLLPKDIEEGLCKDRDFKIISGGYASSRILQIKGVKAVKNFVATVQLGTSGVTLYELGNEDHAVITEKSNIALPDDIETGVIDTSDTRIVAAGTLGTHLYEFRLDNNGNSNDIMKYDIPTNAGRVTKVKFWDETTLSFCTEHGMVALYDIRSKKFASSFAASSQLGDDDSDSSSSVNEIHIYSFDTIPLLHTIGVVDTCGSYESFDVRFIKDKIAHTVLPGVAQAEGLLRGKFNIEYEPCPEYEDNRRFIVTGMNEDIVQIYEDECHGSKIIPIFTHDGHSKPVTHALWHPTADKLLISASVDAVLHAWQYIYTVPEEEEILEGGVAPVDAQNLPNIPEIISPDSPPSQESSSDSDAASLGSGPPSAEAAADVQSEDSGPNSPSPSNPASESPESDPASSGSSAAEEL